MSDREAQLAIPRDYFTQIYEADMFKVDGVRRDKTAMKIILQSLARNLSTLSKTTSILSDVNATKSLSENTLNDYINVFNSDGRGKLKIFRDICIQNNIEPTRELCIQILGSDDAQFRREWSKKQEADRPASQQQIIENNRAISETIKGIKEQILGTADELANTLGNAFIEAFRQGDNAARAWRDAFKSYIGDALSNLLIAKVIAPQLEELIDMYAYGFTDILDENGNIIKDAETQAEEAAKKNNVTLVDWIYKNMTNPKFAKEFDKSSNELLTKFTDFTESLPKSIQDYLFYKSDSSSLSGGIQGITEDTARRLEATGNSQLVEVFSINNKMSSIQSDIAKTASNVALIYALMDNMSKGVNKLHVTMD